ncbi:MAG: hypothetical protein IPO08_17365 [Xanthomonadales bacterium]|nr:hypothetical protein [Xanthomonadales bacterium]
MPEAGLLYERDRMWLCVGDPAALAADDTRFPALMTTLGPWSVQALLDFLVDEHPDLDPSPLRQWSGLLASGRDCVRLRFGGAAMQGTHSGS